MIKIDALAMRLLNKILVNLVNREGFTPEAPEKSSAIVQDVMGFRYQVTVRSLGRNIAWTEKDEEKLTSSDLKAIREMS